MNGIADNVKIMAVRVVPDGDEYDKDVALGIRYAVDNGASYQYEFWKRAQKFNGCTAIKYAAEKDALLSMAGNMLKILM